MQHIVSDETSVAVQQKPAKRRHLPREMSGDFGSQFRTAHNAMQNSGADRDGQSLVLGME